MMVAMVCITLLQACATDEEVRRSVSLSTDTLEEEIPGVKQTVEEVVDEIKIQHASPVELILPPGIPVSEGMYLTALTHGEETNYEVKLFETESPIQVNDPQLEELEPFAILSGTLFELEQEANRAVNYQPIQEGMPKVDLGYGVIGYQEGAAGSTYTTFHEGRWSVTVRSSISEGEKDIGVDFAKQIVERLETQLLPIPHENGSILLTANEQADNPVEANSVTWQEGNVLYEVVMANPLPLIDFVTEK